MLNDLLTSLDDNKISILLLLDPSAAFDTIDHEILSRLKNDFGIRGTAMNWFRAYLCARPCTVYFVYNTTYMPIRKALYSS